MGDSIFNTWSCCKYLNGITDYETSNVSEIEKFYHKTSIVPKIVPVRFATKRDRIHEDPMICAIFCSKIDLIELFIQKDKQKYQYPIYRYLIFSLQEDNFDAFKTLFSNYEDTLKHTFDKTFDEYLKHKMCSYSGGQYLEFIISLKNGIFFINRISPIDGKNMLHYFIDRGHFGNVKTAVQIGHADIERTNNTKETPLMMALSQGYLLIAEFLILNGANVNTYNEIFRENAVELLMKNISLGTVNQTLQILFLMINSGLLFENTWVNRTRQSILYYAILFNDIDLVELIIQHYKIDLNDVVDKNRMYNALEVAVTEENVTINTIKALINLGANPISCDIYGNSKISILSFLQSPQTHHRKEIMEYFLDIQIEYLHSLRDDDIYE